MKYVDTRVWLRGHGCVEGWELSELNKRIDLWNRNEWIRYAFDSFFDWLSFDEGRPIYGFSVLWASRLDAKVHIIKAGGIKK